jgi:hypothetical protein
MIKYRKGKEALMNVYELHLNRTLIDFKADSAELYFDGFENEFLQLDISKGNETITFVLEPDVALYEWRNGKRQFVASNIKMEADMNDPVYGHINDDQMDELRLTLRKED